MEPDPLLPPELLPQPWPGTHARGLFAQCSSATWPVKWPPPAEEPRASGDSDRFCCQYAP
ncbi:PaaX family transcriptional regulator C-terminal domain-containing protein [Streptomyces niveus]